MMNIEYVEFKERVANTPTDDTEVLFYVVEGSPIHHRLNKILSSDNMDDLPSLFVVEKLMIDDKWVHVVRNEVERISHPLENVKCFTTTLQ